MPLYTLWDQRTDTAIARDVLRCTGNDVAIGTICLGLAVWLSAGRAWPDRRFVR